MFKAVLPRRLWWMDLCLVGFAAYLLLAAPVTEAQDPTPSAHFSSAAQRQQEIEKLKQELQTISARLDQLEQQERAADAQAANPAQPQTSSAVPTDAATPKAAESSSSAAPETATAASKAPASEAAKADATNLAFLRGTTFGFSVDGYYSYNFNQPVGRVNTLRAYTETSNSFSLNQADIVVEHLPTPEERAGGRLDLQFGQAAAASQGSSANELRPQVWRNVLQAYGSYLAPVGSGLELDFGKWISGLGVEGTFAKDQINYTRGYSFMFMPYYHMGLRASYSLSSKVNVAYWLVNGLNQTEDFNGFKSQAFAFTLKPANSLTWAINYYFGQEAPDSTASTSGSLPDTNIRPTPNGREHIFDTYAIWTPSSKLTIEPEVDFAVDRNYSEQSPARIAAVNLNARYSLPRNWGLGGRAEYFDDRGGLLSGSTQALKEGTFSIGHLVAPGFLVRAEYRHDFSNQQYFPTDIKGILSKTQNTATLGLMYWWGTKQGSW